MDLILDVLCGQTEAGCPDQTPAEAAMVDSTEGLLYGIYWPTRSYVCKTPGLLDVTGLALYGKLKWVS